MASASAATSTDDQIYDGSDPTHVSKATCSVCRNLAEDNLILDIGEVFKAAATQDCEGCQFLFQLSQEVHFALRGDHLEPGQLLFVNYGNLYPPKEFLMLPDGNMMSQRGKIEVFKTLPQGLSCPWPTIKEGKLTSGNTGSEECLSKITTWLKECEASHESCKVVEEPLLPTRVLDIGGDLSEDPVTISLVETQRDQRGHYICLSHRWIDGDTPTTTENNLVERKRGIEFKTLPKRYQDAITVARVTGMRYLWIDSLCILQEGSPDWSNEAPRMAEYYGNAFLTISASIAVEKGKQCFSKAPSATPTLTVQKNEEVSYAVHYRLPLSHKASPLHSRGWIFQEYMLSRRVVHFLEEEVIWECRQASWCECDRVTDVFEGVFLVEPISTSAHQSFTYRRKTRFQESVVASNTTAMLRNAWMEIVNEYSQMKLTFGSDVFPALAGLAKEMQSRRKCGYYAGIWEDSLASDLLWEAEDEEWYPVGHEYPKPDFWRAPSWSWAASTACINWTHTVRDPTTGEFVGEGLIREIYISDLEATCEPIGDDPAMGLKSASLHLTGNLSIAPLALDDVKGYSTIGVSGEYTVAFDHRMATEDIVDPATLRTILVAKIDTGGEGTFQSLILRPTGTETNLFERIGLMHHPEPLESVEQGVRITIL